MLEKKKIGPDDFQATRRLTTSWISMSTRPRKKITTTTSYKRKKKLTWRFHSFESVTFGIKKKKRGRLVNANFERSLVWFLFGRRRRVHQPIQYYKAIRAAAAAWFPFFFFCFSFERWMLARHTLLLLLLLCEDLMYSNERAAASARLFSGVPIILGWKAAVKRFQTAAIYDDEGRVSASYSSLPRCRDSGSSIWQRNDVVNLLRFDSPVGLL